ncbi:MAG: methylenetetrahydrofolate reductase [NAD(P)H] [Elusimicrobia bacterium]|nr:methylenetetrahydrofolate reductase [NAD(P)H] [Elusimicrobiota bacterium]
MRIPELFRQGGPVFSFEFFLPKAPEDMEGFLQSVRRLKELRPSFVTLTYGAGGSAREKTVETAGRIKAEIGIETACHLTCITHTRAEIIQILDRLEALGIENIVALRGDPPNGQAVPPPQERELAYAGDLVAAVKRRGGFSLAVAGYPETHPEASSPEDDLRRLRAKVRAGGDWVITQLFFDNRDYFDFVRRARAAGVQAPIVPGIMPVTGYAQLKRFTNLCKAKLPPEMTARLEDIQNDPEAVIAYGIEHASRQCLELLEGGAPGIHFYTLNRSRSTAEILSRLRQNL